mmetsp:Transcript_27982/g.47395  ORF Transcript_27982/g.47395 Transcript_27982/m.47395 type:complete len:102 (-) Transcript_27982:55-360(-)
MCSSSKTTLRSSFDKAAELASLALSFSIDASCLALTSAVATALIATPERVKAAPLETGANAEADETAAAITAALHNRRILNIFQSSSKRIITEASAAYDVG